MQILRCSGLGLALLLLVAAVTPASAADNPIQQLEVFQPAIGTDEQPPSTPAAPAPIPVVVPSAAAPPHSLPPVPLTKERMHTLTEHDIVVSHALISNRAAARALRQSASSVFATMCAHSGLFVCVCVYDRSRASFRLPPRRFSSCRSVPTFGWRSWAPR